jgi:hypothetical protein
VKMRNDPRNQRDFMHQLENRYPYSGCTVLSLSLFRIIEFASLESVLHVSPSIISNSSKNLAAGNRYKRISFMSYK